MIKSPIKRLLDFGQSPWLDFTITATPKARLAGAGGEAEHAIAALGIEIDACLSNASMTSRCDGVFSAASRERPPAATSRS